MSKLQELKARVEKLEAAVSGPMVYQEDSRPEPVDKKELESGGYSSNAYLQLHDNHTLWQVGDKYDEDDYNKAVEDAQTKFEKKTGQDLYLLGRSGRHVCVDLTKENVKNFKKLQDLALKLEKDIVKSTK